MAKQGQADRFHQGTMKMCIRDRATGGLIARRRKEKNWSQGELTERLHVTDKAVSRWETGRGLPDENPWALGLA